jgi:hypothetical protein
MEEYQVKRDEYDKYMKMSLELKEELEDIMEIDNKGELEKQQIKEVQT